MQNCPPLLTRAEGLFGLTINHKIYKSIEVKAGKILTFQKLQSVNILILLLKKSAAGTFCNADHSRGEDGHALEKMQ